MLTAVCRLFGPYQGHNSGDRHPRAGGADGMISRVLAGR
jgi:hypothetical protein